MKKIAKLGKGLLTPHQYYDHDQSFTNQLLQNGWKKWSTVCSGCLVLVFEQKYRKFHQESHKNETVFAKENEHEYASLKLLQKLAKQALASNDQTTAIELYSRIIDCLTTRKIRLEQESQQQQQAFRGEVFSLEDRAILYDSYLQRSLLTHSVEDASRLIELTPDSFASYYVRGLYYSSRNEKENALQDFNMVLKLNPDYSDGYIQRAKLYYTQFKDNVKAIQDFERAFQLSPNLENIEIYYLRVAHLCADPSHPPSYNLEKAYNYLEKAFRIFTEQHKPIPLSLYNELCSCCYELHRYEKALYWAHLGIKQFQHDYSHEEPLTNHTSHTISMLYYNRGNLLWHQRFKRKDLALRDLEKALSYSPHHIQALLQLAWLYLHTEEEEKSVDSTSTQGREQCVWDLLRRAENALELDEKQRMDQSSMQTDDMNADQEEQDHYRSWKVHHATLYSLKAELNLTRNEWDQAMKNVNYALQLCPQSELAYFNRGQIWIHQRDFEKARMDFEQAIDIVKREGMIFSEDELKELIQKSTTIDEEEGPSEVKNDEAN
nr:unnamed protein product [Naegleria fowleri]